MLPKGETKREKREREEKKTARSLSNRGRRKKASFPGYFRVRKRRKQKALGKPALVPTKLNVS